MFKISASLLIYSLRACSHEPGTVNYSWIMIVPGQALPRVHMMICCPGQRCPGTTVAHKGQCNKKSFAANKKDRIQTKKIGCKQKRSDTNKKDNANKKDRMQTIKIMQTKKIGCKQKDNANKKDRMQTKRIGCKQKGSDANKKPKPVTMQALT